MSFTTDDTIVAIATPPGRGGLGVVRISGPDAERIARRVTEHEAAFTPRHATLTRTRTAAGAFDHVVATYFAAPHSYTAEDVVEISAHGSPVLLRQIVSACLAEGARLAEPGEFTFRAYLHGRIDLVQAEAVRDLVDAVTPLQARAAFDQLEGTLSAKIREIDAALFEIVARFEASLDFPGEGYHFVDAETAAEELAELADRVTTVLRDAGRGRLVREGAHVVLAGRPNAGKSSLFNALAGAGRAIVTDLPGTTRDLVTEVVEIEGLPITLVDTAGVHGTAADAVEAEGMARAHAARAVADAVIVVLDRSRPLEDADRRLLSDTARSCRIVAANKSDLPSAWQDERPHEGAVIAVSAMTGAGIDDLRQGIAETLGCADALRDTPSITNVRHVDVLTRARDALARAAEASRRQTPEEFVLLDITDARHALEDVAGRRTPDDVLAAIFNKFCIGK